MLLTWITTLHTRGASPAGATFALKNLSARTGSEIFPFNVIQNYRISTQTARDSEEATGHDLT